MRIARVGAAAKIRRQAGGFELDLGGGFEIACHHARDNSSLAASARSNSAAPGKGRIVVVPLQQVMVVALAQIDCELLPSRVAKLKINIGLG